MDCGSSVGQVGICPDFQKQPLWPAEIALWQENGDEPMEYQRIEVTEWYDKEGRVRKRRLRHERFVLSLWELNQVCNSLVKISDGASRAIVAASRRNPYLLK